MPHFSQIAQHICQTQLEEWTDPEYVDSGASAEVYVVKRDENLAALKVFDPAFFQGKLKSSSVERIRRQQTLLGQHHPYLVSILSSGEVKEYGTWFILMEYVPPPNLRDALSRISREQVRPLIQQLVEVVKWLEEKGLYHRDIKPANIAINLIKIELKLLDLGIIKPTKLEDFGTDETGQRQFIATVQYSSPEYIIRAKGSSADDELHALNLYQVGAVLHDMIVKRPMFGEIASLHNKFALADAIAKVVPIFPSDPTDHDLAQIASDCLLKDPRERARRVSWARFFERPDDPAAARARLKRVNQTSSSSSHGNAAKIQLESVERTLRETIVAAISYEKGVFPPFSTKMHSSSEKQTSVTITLEKIPEVNDLLQCRFNFTIIARHGTDIYDVFLSTEICKRESIFHPASGDAPILSGEEASFTGNAVELILNDKLTLLYDQARARLLGVDLNGIATWPGEILK